MITIVLISDAAASGYEACDDCSNIVILLAEDSNLITAGALAA